MGFFRGLDRLAPLRHFEFPFRENSRCIDIQNNSGYLYSNRPSPVSFHGNAIVVDINCYFAMESDAENKAHKKRINSSEGRKKSKL